MILLPDIPLDGPVLTLHPVLTEVLLGPALQVVLHQTVHKGLVLFMDDAHKEGQKLTHAARGVAKHVVPAVAAEYLTAWQVPQPDTIVIAGQCVAPAFLAVLQKEGTKETKKKFLRG